MELPKFLLCDNTDFPDDIFVLHLEYPRFIMNLKDDQIELLEEPDDVEEEELELQMNDLITQIYAFYDREVNRYDES